MAGKNTGGGWGAWQMTENERQGRRGGGGGGERTLQGCVCGGGGVKSRDQPVGTRKQGGEREISDR